jgi:hypothetical protein
MKKLLSILLALTMLLSCTTLYVSAEGEGEGEGTPEPALTFEVTGSYTLAENVSVTELLFSYDLTVDSSKICAIDGESKDYTYELKSLSANGIDYMTDPDAFFAYFNSEEYAGTTLFVTFVINFESDKVFGTLDYKCNISGFMAPLSIGLGPVDDALANVALPVEVVVEGNVWNFPKLDTATVINRPTKQDYKDTEKFDLSGTTIAVETIQAVDRVEKFDENGNTYFEYTYAPGFSGIVTYGPENANMFTCHPSKDANLTVDTREVISYFDGVEIEKLPVNVEHAWSNGYVNITTDKYTEGKPGYHATLCDGCGEAHDAQPHIPSPVLDEEGNVMYDDEGNEICWTYNNDQTFTSNGTESSICMDCGAVLTRDVFSSADYNDAFANYHFLRVIFDYINTLLRILDAAFGL